MTLWVYMPLVCQPLKMYITLNLTHFLRELIRIMFIIGCNNWIILLAMKISLLIIC